MRVAIVIGSFHSREASIMLAAAEEAIKAKNLILSGIVKVPGSYEKPLATKRLLKDPEVDAVVVLGIIERGETSHGRVMGQSVSDALVGLQLEYMKPIGVGILGPDIEPHQFGSRIKPYAVAAVEAVAIMGNANSLFP